MSHSVVLKKCILNWGELLMDTICFVAGRDGGAPRTCLFTVVLPFGDILANLVSTFAAFGHHYYSLWPKATTPERSQKLYLIGLYRSEDDKGCQPSSS